jgi:tungstate transport system permease protein
MHDFAGAFAEAFRLLLAFDSDLREIVFLSLQVSLSAVVVASLIGLPFGAFLAVARFPGRRALVVAVTAMMGLPPVVVGLVVYMLLSNAGALGPLQLLYTPTAMVIAQAVLIAPIIAALSRQTIEDLNGEYAEQMTLFGLSRRRRLLTLIWEARFSLMTTFLAGFGRGDCRGRRRHHRGRQHQPRYSRHDDDDRARNVEGQSGAGARSRHHPRRDCHCRECCGLRAARHGGARRLCLIAPPLPRAQALPSPPSKAGA